MSFKFELGDHVQITGSPENGTVIARSDSSEMVDQYEVRYLAGDGRMIETWWSGTALNLSDAARVNVTPATPATPAAAHIPVSEPFNDDNVEPVQVETLVDDDGMPWDGSIHAGTQTKTAKGQWKSLKGKAAEATAARAEFKASGGGLTPPDVTAAPVAAPAPAAPAAPALPSAPAAPAAEITLEQVSDLLVSKYTGGGISDGDLANLYGRVGITNAADPTPELASNAEIRAKLYSELLLIA